MRPTKARRARIEHLEADRYHTATDWVRLAVRYRILGSRSSRKIDTGA